MSYTPLDADQIEYLAQVKRHRDAMIGALQSESVRVPETVRNLAQQMIESGYTAVEFWIRFRVTSVKWKA